jgi:hypothetical protein
MLIATSAALEKDAIRVCGHNAKAEKSNGYVIETFLAIPSFNFELKTRQDMLLCIDVRNENSDSDFVARS